jgi:hypothetical protein
LAASLLVGARRLSRYGKEYVMTTTKNVSRRVQVGNELSKIQAESGDGMLRPEDVVAWAEAHPKSALFGQFEWDNTQAAHEHRLNQARGVIRIHVTILDHAKPETTRAWVSLTTDRNRAGGYRAIGEVLSDEVLSAQLLADAYRVMKNFMVKYGALQELAGVVAAMEEVVTAKKKTA